MVMPLFEPENQSWSGSGVLVFNTVAIIMEVTLVTCIMVNLGNGATSYIDSNGLENIRGNSYSSGMTEDVLSLVLLTLI